MKAITLSTIVAVTLLATSTSGYAAAKGTPFSALDELIQANTAEIANNKSLIEANSADIAENADSITELNTEIETINLTLDNVDARILANTADIAAANLAISTSQENINDLTIRISTVNNNLSREINTLKTSVSTLSSSLTELNRNLTIKTDALNAAIAANSSDIAMTSAIVTAMNSSLTASQTEIIAILTRIANAEATLDVHTDALSFIDAQLWYLDLRVTALESAGDREITITGTSADDYAPGELKALVESLNVTNDDWIYIKAESSRGTGEICSSNDDVVTVLNGFVNGDDRHYYYGNSTDNGQTVVKVAGSSTWADITYLSFYSFTRYGGHLEVFAAAGGDYARLGLIEDYSYDLGIEILHGSTWDAQIPNTVLIKIGATRLEACGF